MLKEYFASVSDTNLIKGKVQLVKIYWRILNKFLSSRLLNFSVFSLYSDSTFNDYIKINLDLKFLLFEQVFAYPKLAAIFIQNILVVSEQYLETVFALPKEDYAINLFLISKRFMQKITQENFKYGNFSTIHEDTLISNVSAVI